MKHIQTKHTNEYANLRTKRGDDRTSESKRNADAVLRGKIGSYAANKVIAALDGMKSRGII